MEEITVQELQNILQTKGNDNSLDFINVCTPAEYNEQHIKGVRNVPLDTLGDHVAEFSNKKTIYVHCRSGKRGAKAVETLRELKVTADLVNVSGGLMAWKEAGLPTRSLT